MKVQHFKKLLKTKKASWSLMKDISDELKISEISVKNVSLGALPTPRGSVKTRLPRIRRPLNGPLYPWIPNTIIRLRPTQRRLPQSWDWRNIQNKNWVTDARNQGSCGSCVAFAIVGTVEAHRRIEKNSANLNVDLSESSLYFVADRQCNAGDPRWGWWINRGLDAMVDEGVCVEDIYPYRAVNQEALLSEGTERTIKISGYDSTSNTNRMKRWLCEEGPLVTRFTVYNDFYTFWRSGHGVYSHTTGANSGGHAVMVVGYDDNDSCWICKNSWGTNTAHTDGFFKIKYGECGIDSKMYLVQDVYDVITRDRIYYNPRTLQIKYEGHRGWLLTDGRSRIKIFDNKEDARNGMRVARRHRYQGFIGRDNSRSKRINYIVEYWGGYSGLPYEPLTKTDAIAYNPNNVLAEDRDDKGWRIKDGNHWMLQADDMNDALAVVGLVERHTRMCFIGRGNKRSNRKSYIMTYWE